MNSQSSIVSFFSHNHTINTKELIRSKLDAITTNNTAAVTIAADTDADAGAVTKIAELEQELKSCKLRAECSEKQLKHAKAALKQSASLCLEKDLRIKVLENKLKKFEEKKGSGDLYRMHASHFKPNELQSIRSVRSGKRNDSTFVSKIVSVLYGGNSNILENKSVSGKKQNKRRKEASTPEKVSLILEMLKERITNEDDQDNIGKRLKTLNTHLKNAIYQMKQNCKKTTEGNATISTTPLATPTTSEMSHFMPAYTPMAQMQSNFQSSRTAHKITIINNTIIHHHISTYE